MRRRLETAFAASPSAVRDAVVESLDLTANADDAGGFTGMLSGSTGLGLHVVVDGGDDDGNAEPTPVQFETASHDSIPYFGWFVNLLRRIEAGRALRYSIARVTAALDDADAPDPPRRISLLPPVAFTAEQTSRLAAIALVAASASFTVAQLFTRAFVNAVLVIAGLAAVEDAPEGARAFASRSRSSCSRWPTSEPTAGVSRSARAR